MDNGDLIEHGKLRVRSESYTRPPLFCKEALTYQSVPGFKFVVPSTSASSGVSSNIGQQVKLRPVYSEPVVLYTTKRTWTFIDISLEEESTCSPSSIRHEPGENGP